MRSIVILISGRGSNMEAIVRAAQAERWPARIAAVISNRADASGLEFAARHGIATAVIAVLMIIIAPKLNRMTFSDEKAAAAAKETATA